jgi:CDP-2,3-bis-(O-geranylgeranyl)-sn-glycerol synthase
VALAMQLDLVIKFLVLLTMANGTPVIAKKLLTRFLPSPIDDGTTLGDGRPLFGPSKTLRGLVVAVAATTLSAPALGLAWTIGLLAGVAAMAGDLGSSFAKRRMGLPSSSRALGLDQIPEALLPALVCKSLLALTLVDIAVIVVLFTIGEMLLSRLLFKLHVRDQPY